MGLQLVFGVNNSMLFSVMNNISYKILDKFIFIILIILISGASILSDFNESLIVVLFFFIIISNYKKIIYDKIVFFIILFWVFINLFSSINNPTAFSSDEFFGIIIRVLISYLGIKIVGDSFWFKFENIIYRLVLISLPIYLLNLVLPELFNSLSPIFKPITSQIFYRKEVQVNYWYSFFYTNLGRDEIRNSGFMWEPGAFAMMIIIALIINCLNNGIGLQKKIFIYILALITTMSTIGYLSLLVLLLAYFIYNKKKYFIIILLPIIILFGFTFTSTSFLGPKISMFLEEYESNTFYEQGYGDRLEANRILYFSLCVEKSLKYPFGYGVLKDEESLIKAIKIVGVNGLGEVLLAWGWFGIIFLVVSIYKFCRSIYFNFFISFLLSLTILFSFFSNPIERNIILFLIVLTPFTIKHTKFS